MHQARVEAGLEKEYNLTANETNNKLQPVKKDSILMGPYGKPILDPQGNPMKIHYEPIIGPDGKPELNDRGRPAYREMEQQFDEDGKPMFGPDNKILYKPLEENHKLGK